MSAGSDGGGSTPAWLSWSSGKDSAYAFEVVRREGRYRITALLTTLTETYGRVSIHGVREELLDAQAASLGVPLVKVRIPFPCPNEIYERQMARAMAEARSQGVRHVVFGDLFLEDVRAYRESHLAPIGMHAVFPLWGRPTAPLARTMLEDGLRARIAALDPKKLSSRFAGREFDLDLLRALPQDVDPCGERGEFHTFVTRTPSFARPLDTRVGEIVERDGFVFADLLPV